MQQKRTGRTTHAKEYAQLESSYRSVSGRRTGGKYSAKKSSVNGRTAAIITICLTVVLVIGLIIGINVLLKREDSKYGGLRVAGINISGMTQDQARHAIENATATSYSRLSMEIILGDTVIELTPGLSGAALDVDALMAAIEQSKMTSGDFDILPYLSLNEEAILNKLKESYALIESELIQTSWTLEGDAPALDQEEVTEPCQTLTVTVGTPMVKTDLQLLYQQILKHYNQNDFRLEFPLTIIAPDALDVTAIYQQICTEPRDAKMDMQTFEVSPHLHGYAFQQQELEALLSAAEYGETVSISMYTTAPEVTAKSLKDVLFRDELGSYKAVSESLYGRDINLKLSCQAINGIVLMPGDIFAYDATLGERTPEKGYQQAAGYVGMETIQTYGGGICQASSALYYSALIADLDIIQRHSHTFISSYMPFGMDATVSWKGPDLKIRNNTDYPIRIEAEASAGTVIVRLMGTDTKDYYVKMEYEVDKTVPYETVYEELPPDNPEGYKDGDVIITPYTGYTITTYKCKYDKETNALLSREKEVTSVYEARNEVICKIIEATEPTEPSEPTDPTEPSRPDGPITEDGS